MKQSLPNYLTWSRVLMIPVIAVLILIPGTWANYLSAALFCLVAFTDWLDGYLARKWKVESPFGAFLDPVADKLLVVVLLILLGMRDAVKVAPIGKLKTTLQMMAIALLLLAEPFSGSSIYETGLVILYAAAAVTLVSMIQYLMAAAKSLSA